MRYYQSIIDISILTPGMEYGSLKKSFVIFICNYDEYGRDRYLYTFENTCREEPDLKFGDESYKIVVNTKGRKGDINAHLKEVLEYLDDGSVTGDYSRELDEAVKAVKSSEERRLEYMLLVTRDNEMRAEGRAEGRVEGRAEGRAEGEIIGAIKLYNDELGLSPEEIVSRITVRFSLEKNVAERYVGETLHLSGND
jgi:predicted transposase/invertase (TIGR01784 family)